MRIQIPDAYASRLARLAAAAGLSRARWVRAAIRAAEQDPSVARRIEDAAPDSSHGGARPGAGRPRKTAEDTKGQQRGGIREHRDNAEED